jgi:hypothetical protein
MLIFCNGWIWMESVKIQEMNRYRYGNRGWNWGVNGVLLRWADVGRGGAILG